jgi:hypothetical protein
MSEPVWAIACRSGGATAKTPIATAQAATASATARFARSGRHCRCGPGRATRPRCRARPGRTGSQAPMEPRPPCTRRASPEHTARTHATGAAWGVVSRARIRSRPSPDGSSGSTAECSARRSRSSGSRSCRLTLPLQHVAQHRRGPEDRRLDGAPSRATAPAVPPAPPKPGTIRHRKEIPQRPPRSTYPGRADTKQPARARPADDATIRQWPINSLTASGQVEGGGRARGTNAVLGATGATGAAINTTAFTPERVWRALRTPGARPA